MKNFRGASLILIIVVAVLIEMQFLMFAYLEEQNIHLWGDQLDLNQKIVNAVYNQCTQ